MTLFFISKSDKVKEIESIKEETLNLTCFQKQTQSDIAGFDIDNKKLNKDFTCKQKKFEKYSKELCASLDTLKVKVKEKEKQISGIDAKIDQVKEAKAAFIARAKQMNDKACEVIELTKKNTELVNVRKEDRVRFVDYLMEQSNLANENFIKSQLVQIEWMDNLKKEYFPNS